MERGDTSVGLTSDFSPIAARYDATRGIPEACLSACYEDLVERGLFPAEGSVLDAGCGTGQISLPLAMRGYDLCGIDISAEMISIAQSKQQLGWHACYQVADVRKLPVDMGPFDAIVVSKLFQHVQNWQEACCELLRVLRPGGCLVQINERGAFSNPVRRFFSRRADELGFSGRFLGLNPHSDQELTAYMAQRGINAVLFDNPALQWDACIDYGEAIRLIEERLFAEFWYLPTEIHAQLVAETTAWVEAQPAGRMTIARLKPRLIVHAFRKAGLNPGP